MTDDELRQKVLSAAETCDKPRLREWLLGLAGEAVKAPSTSVTPRRLSPPPEPADQSRRAA